MKTPFLSGFTPLLAMLAAISLTPAALAVKVPASIAGVNTTQLYSSNGTERGFPDEGMMNYLFDGDFEGKGVRISENGAYLLVDFTSIIAEGNSVYVSEISVGHSGNSDYSILVSEDNSTWTAIASSVVTSGKTSYPVAQRAKYVKYVFDTANNLSDSLIELEVKGYESSVPHVVSKWANVTMHNILWGADTFGGGYGNPANVFNGRFGDYQMLPRSASWLGSFFLIDFTAVSPDGYYIEKTLVDSTGKKKFTLQYSEDGTTWQNVDGAENATTAGIGTYPGGFVAKQMKYIFVDGGDGSYSDEFLAEIQVWGMDPDDVPCTHPSYTEWTASIPATCTERAQEERFCTVCGERFTKISDSLPLGHDYVSVLERPGRYTPELHFPDDRSFGAGCITCSRCDFRLDFPTAIDLATSRVDNASICGIKTEGVVRFADLSVSSTDHPEWGPADFRLIDNIWRLPFPNENLWSYWVSAGLENQYVDFEFGTQINLSMVEISVKNHGYVLRFVDVDDETGTETVLGEHAVVRDDTVVGTTTEKGTAVDPNTGEEVEVDVEKEVYADYQRLKIPFYENAVKHLRIRIEDESGTNLGWGYTGVCVIEAHPWGTVVGASDFPADRTTLLIFK